MTQRLLLIVKIKCSVKFGTITVFWCNLSNYFICEHTYEMEY